jgi:general secretion pathway protein G
MTRKTISKILLASAALACIALSYVVVASYSGNAKDAERKATRAALAACETALDMYKIDCKAYPTELQDLRALMVNPGAAGWNGPYLRDGLPLDGWRNSLRYSRTDGVVRITSAGRDGIFGTRDDIVQNCQE